MPLSVKPMFPEQTQVRIHLMITLIIWALERMGTWFPLLCFEPQRVHLEIHFVVLGKMMVVLALMWSITLDTLWILNSTCVGTMFPLPVIITLGDAQVYICFSDSGNMSFYIKTPVNQHFTILFTLSILNIDLNNYHVRPGRSLDNSQFYHE